MNSSMKILSGAMAIGLLSMVGAANAGARDDLNAFTKGLKGLDGNSPNRSLVPTASKKSNPADVWQCPRRACFAGNTSSRTRN
jgi:hypothetical protein